MPSQPLLSSAAFSLRASRQLFLPGLDFTSSTDGLFLGILPEAPAAEEIANLADALRSQHGLQGRPLADRLHLSLHDLSIYLDSTIDMVARIAEAAAALRTPPIEVTFDRVLSFRRNQPEQALVLRSGAKIEALQNFHHDLGIALRRAGLGHRLHHDFTPHVTLLYDPKRIVERSVEPVSWTVRQFTLIHSLRGRSQYRTLGHWPLSG